MVSVTTPATNAVSDGQSARTAEAEAKSTKANSPACGSSSAILHGIVVGGAEERGRARRGRPP